VISNELFVQRCSRGATKNSAPIRARPAGLTSSIATAVNHAKASPSGPPTEPVVAHGAGCEDGPRGQVKHAELDKKRGEAN